MHANDPKLDSIDVTGDLNIARKGWEHSWSQATGPQYYNKDRTFVDLAKQTTSEDSTLPCDPISGDHGAGAFLWKSVARMRMVRHGPFSTRRESSQGESETGDVSLGQPPQLSGLSSILALPHSSELLERANIEGKLLIRIWVLQKQ
jgi:hypothetical protein